MTFIQYTINFNKYFLHFSRTFKFNSDRDFASNCSFICDYKICFVLSALTIRKLNPLHNNINKPGVGWIFLLKEGT